LRRVKTLRSAAATSLDSLRCAGTLNDGWNCPRLGFDIQPERALIDVLDVEAHPLVERDGAAAADLPQAGNARPAAEVAALPVIIEAVVVPHR